MENDIKPSTIMLIAGGAVMFISTFLDWFSSGNFGVNGWETDIFGFQGVFVAIIGLVVAGGVALTTFADVSLPDRVLGFTRTQIYVSLAEAAFLITFGLMFAGDTGVGLFLGWIAAAVVVAGGIMEMQAESGGSAPPTQF